MPLGDVKLLPIFNREPVVRALAESVDWGLRLTGVPELHKMTKGRGIKIGYLDTGIDSTHPDFRGGIFAAEDFTGEGTQDDHGHGSHVAGIGGARADGNGIIGVAPESGIGSYKCLGARGGGGDRETSAAIAKACADGCDILSMSWGTNQIGPVTRAALSEAYRTGKILIAAFGNAGPTSFGDEPGRLQICTGVVACDQRGNLASFSSRGQDADVGAPGVRITSCAPGGGYQIMDGTSQAAPFIAGLAALILAKHREVGGKTDLKNQDDWDAHLDRALEKQSPAADGNKWWLGRPIDLVEGDESIVAPPPKPGKKPAVIDLGFAKVYIPARAGDAFSVAAK